MAQFRHRGTGFARRGTGFAHHGTGTPTPVRGVATGVGVSHDWPAYGLRLLVLGLVLQLPIAKRPWSMPHSRHLYDLELSG